MQILQKLIDLASSEKEEAKYTVSCMDMHKRNKDLRDDYSETYGFFIYNSELIINELEDYLNTLSRIRLNLELDFNNEFDFEDAEGNVYKDVHEYLLDYYFSESCLYIPSQPTDRIVNLIEYYYNKKKVYSEGFAKFFTIQKKKLIKDEEGNNILVDWTESDELNKIASEDLAKIELLQQWDSFIDTMSKVKEMLENKEDVLEILKLIK